MEASKGLPSDRGVRGSLDPALVAPCVGGWALLAGIGMTINLPGHPKSVT